MKKRFIVIPAVVLVVVSVVAGWWLVSSRPGLLDQIGLGGEGAPRGVLAASGIIEADEVSVTAEMGGRVAEVLADEGDSVEEGDVLIRLDEALLLAQMAQAEAASETAQAALAQLDAGASDENVRRAEALVGQAEVVRDGARQALKIAIEP